MYGEPIALIEPKAAAEVIARAYDVSRRIRQSGEEAQRQFALEEQQKLDAKRLARMHAEQNDVKRQRAWSRSVRAATETIEPVSTAAFWRFVDAECRERGVTRAEVVSASRKGWLVKARMEIIYATRCKFPHLTVTLLGQRFRRDHTTILNATRKFGGLPNA